MQKEEVLRIIRRITRDFSPLLPGLRLEVVSPEGFRARLQGKPLIADEDALQEVLKEVEGGGGSAPPGDLSVESSSPLLCGFPASRTIIIELEGLSRRVSREDRRLHRPLVEGLILREVLYLMTSRQPLPDPRSRAENILRRHWPFQYAALRSVGLTVTGFQRPPAGPELARDN